MASPVESMSDGLERALATFQDQWAKLHPDGRPLFVPEEQATRVERLNAGLAAVIRQAEAVADEELDTVATIERPMKEPGDPIADLLPSELSRASALMPFAQQDIGNLTTPVGQLAARQRCREAVARGDRAMCAVYLRLVRDRDDMEDVADQLAAIIWPAQMADRRKLAARKSRARDLKMAALNAGTMARQGGAVVGDLAAYARATGPYSPRGL